jgi:hypothetical protein
VVAKFVGGHANGALHGKNDELVALPAPDFPAWFQMGLSIGFSAMLDTIHDDLPGQIVDLIEEAIIPDSEAMAFAS